MQAVVDLKENRKYPRRRYRRPVGILFQGQFWLSRGEELGEGGMLVTSPREIPDGALVLLTLFIPGGDIAILRSETRYHANDKNENGFHVGFQFLNFSFKYKKKIRDYVAAKSEAEAVSDRLNK